MLVLMYHLAPFRESELIQPGLADLVEVPVIAKQDVDPNNRSQLSLRQALLSTASAASVVVDGVTEPTLPFDFSLSQNYPNPFNPTTTIQFEIGRDQGGAATRDVRLDIFNVLGQRVTTLVDDALSPGRYEIVWDATNKSGSRVATGLYLYRLKVGNESQAKKMLFLK